MMPTPTLPPHNEAAAAADHDTTRMPVLPGNADTRKRKADQLVPYDPSPDADLLARMPTVSNIEIDYAQFEQHVREIKTFLSDGAFSCPVCRKVFAGNTPENAMKHLLRHLDDHSLYPYKCAAHDGCDYTAVTEDEVEQHVTREHQAVWAEDVKRQCTRAENKARLDVLCEEVKLMLRRGLLVLPSENVLDVLHCLDFATLLALQRSGSVFYDVVHPNLAILPRLRVFEFYLDLAKCDPTFTLREIVGDTRNIVLSSPFEVPFTDEFDYSLLQPFADAVGTNFINCAIIASSHGEMQAMDFDMHKAVESLPALKHVRELTFECRCLMHTSYAFDMETLEELILSPLDNLQCLELSEMKNRTDWAFLRNEWALRLRSLSVEPHGLFYDPTTRFPELGYAEIGAPGQSEILEYCTDFVHIEKGKSKKLKITGWMISPEFLQRIITTVSGCKDWLTVVVDGAPGFVGSDTDYARADVPPENPRYAWEVGFVRYSSRVGTHRVFVHTFDGHPTIAVTNNPFITTWDDTHKWGIEGL